MTNKDSLARLKSQLSQTDNDGIYIKDLAGHLDMSPKDLIQAMKTVKGWKVSGKEVIREGTTPQFKALHKRAKQLGIETSDELQDLINSEFDDETKFISGADYEILRKHLKLESNKSSLQKLVESGDSVDRIVNEAKEWDKLDDDPHKLLIKLTKKAIERSEFKLGSLDDDESGTGNKLEEYSKRTRVGDKKSFLNLYNLGFIQIVRNGSGNSGGKLSTKINLVASKSKSYLKQFESLNESKASDYSVNEAEMPAKFIGNDEIVFLKTKENSRGAHYNLYYKGHDIDFGGRVFGSKKQLEDFANNYILSNQWYKKLRYKDPIPLPESGKSLQKLVESYYSVDRIVNSLCEAANTEELDEWDIRAAMADCGKTSVRDLMAYVESKYKGRYDKKLARENAREMAKEMKSYM